MILLTPGPTPVPDRVLDAMRRQPIPHRSRAFETLLAGCQPGLRRLFSTDGAVLTLAGSGTTAMEAIIRSLAPVSGSVVACHSGKFGERWAEAARRAVAGRGGAVREVRAPWGEPITPDALRAALAAAPDAGLVVFVHSETSTATASDARALASVVRESAPGALVAMDAVTSAGVLPLEMDRWGIDAAATASQKALGLPPGLGFVALGERAEARLADAAPDLSLSLDLARALGAHRAGRTPFTPAINLVFGLAEALAMIDEEGAGARVERAARLARATRSAAGAAGLGLPSRAPSDAVTAVEAPDGLADRARAWCERERGVLLAGGQNQWAGRVMRISHMGSVGDAQTRAGVGAILDALDGLAPGAFDTAAGRDALEARLAEPIRGSAA
ncbi:MAG: alanine--glyoxylate aminotransferase family protein [Planctomycetota bacterium]|nr:MAG: alanine--glyoxylate aminotransferase family protein [Planctomycetota bacterium]